MSPTERPLPCTATLQRRFSMARNRASMREGPLADLFRATEAAQRQGKEPEQHRQQELPVDEAPLQTVRARPVLEEEPPAAPTPIRAVAPAPDPTGDEPESRAGRWLDPIPDQPARLERARDSASYV